MFWKDVPAKAAYFLETAYKHTCHVHTNQPQAHLFHHFFSLILSYLANIPCPTHPRAGTRQLGHSPITPEPLIVCQLIRAKLARACLPSLCSFPAETTAKASGHSLLCHLCFLTHPGTSPWDFEWHSLASLLLLKLSNKNFSQ